MGGSVRVLSPIGGHLVKNPFDNMSMLRDYLVRFTLRDTDEAGGPRRYVVAVVEKGVDLLNGP